MSLHGAPGIGGGLGQCAVCGDSFVKEILIGCMIPTVGIDGIAGDLCLHDKCLELMQSIKGTGWENLPEGPLRKIYAEAAEDEDRV